MCYKQITTGEQLYVVDENKFMCKQDYMVNKKFQGRIKTDIFIFFYLTLKLFKFDYNAFQSIFKRLFMIHREGYCSISLTKCLGKLILRVSVVRVWVSYNKIKNDLYFINRRF
jgi:hypothetical protein